MPLWIFNCYNKTRNNKKNITVSTSMNWNIKYYDILRNNNTLCTKGGKRMIPVESNFHEGWIAFRSSFTYHFSSHLSGEIQFFKTTLDLFHSCYGQDKGNFNNSSGGIVIIMMISFNERSEIAHFSPCK